MYETLLKLVIQLSYVLTPHSSGKGRDLNSSRKTSSNSPAMDVSSIPPYRWGNAQVLSGPAQGHDSRLQDHTAKLLWGSLALSLFQWRNEGCASLGIRSLSMTHICGERAGCCLSHGTWAGKRVPPHHQTRLLPWTMAESTASPAGKLLLHHL